MTRDARHDGVDVRTVLLEQRAWVRHWLDDIAANLKPSESSLRDALARIDAALADQREPKP